MLIRLTEFLEVSPSNAQYDSERRLREKCNVANWSDDSEIKEAIATDVNEDDDEENFWEKNGQLKKEK